jgi:Resolvase, N terminal domain
VRAFIGLCTSCGCGSPLSASIPSIDVEPGVSATDDRRPEFQRTIDAATKKSPVLDVILVHSFSRFFRDQFQLGFYLRRLAKKQRAAGGQAPSLILGANCRLARGVSDGWCSSKGPKNFGARVTLGRSGSSWPGKTFTKESEHDAETEPICAGTGPYARP